MTEAPATLTAAQNFAEQLEAHFRQVHQTAMRDLPICNQALRVEAFGFRAHGDHLIGVMVTPWFLNIFAAPLTAGPVEDGTLILPAGAVDFAAHDYPGLGRLLSCSLFSPMDIFIDHEAAAATARASLDLLFKAPESAPEKLAPQNPAPEKAAVDRRAFFRFAPREARP